MTTAPRTTSPSSKAAQEQRRRKASLGKCSGIEVRGTATKSTKGTKHNKKMNDSVFPDFFEKSYIDVSVPLEIPGVRTEFHLGDDSPLGKGILVFNTRVTYQLISAKKESETQTKVILKSNELGKLKSKEETFTVVGRNVNERARDLCSQLRKIHGDDSMISTRTVMN